MNVKNHFEELFAVESTLDKIMSDNVPLSMAKSHFISTLGIKYIVTTSLGYPESIGRSITVR